MIDRLTREAHQTTDSSHRLGYRIAELAQKLGVSRSTVERRIADGTLQTSRTIGGTIILANSVERALHDVKENLKRGKKKRAAAGG